MKNFTSILVYAQKQHTYLTMNTKHIADTTVNSSNRSRPAKAQNNLKSADNKNDGHFWR